jgi:hypothetical protein
MAVQEALHVADWGPCASEACLGSWIAGCRKPSMKTLSGRGMEGSARMRGAQPRFWRSSWVSSWNAARTLERQRRLPVDETAPAQGAKRVIEARSPHRHESGCRPGQPKSLCESRRQARRVVGTICTECRITLCREFGIESIPGGFKLEAQHQRCGSRRRRQLATPVIGVLSFPPRRTA